jgi:soluble lytic murein transglycosylase-like protein
MPAGARPVTTRRRRLLLGLILGATGGGAALFAGSGVLDRAVASAPTAARPQPYPWAGLSLLVPGSARLDLRRPEQQEATQHFDLHVRERLPRYQSLFQQAALLSDTDWRLLAAIGYQESNWDPHAVSPTGVRGIMMLAQGTADELDVDRDSPAECIEGGALYFQQIRDRLPSQIREPDRTNMALAAYNQGLGHLQDARSLAAQLGGDPDSWHDVRNALPLLADERWFNKVRHGYAAGGEAVRYVLNVRQYYERLHTVPAAPLPAPLQVASAGL